MKPLLFFCLLPGFLSAQTPVLSGIINSYAPVLDFGCDSGYLLVASNQGFAPGDKVLIIQMQGAIADSSNTAQFGSIISPGDAGHFELNRIEGISGNVIHLKYSLISGYDPKGKVQLIRVPEYTDVEINGLSCKAWDGSTGGVLILEAHNTIDVSGPVNVSGKGFRGGMYSNSSAYDKCHFLDYYYTPNPDSSAAKGEGIALLPADKSFGRGRSVNAGGGGNAHNAGGAEAAISALAAAAVTNTLAAILISFKKRKASPAYRWPICTMAPAYFWAAAAEPAIPTTKKAAKGEMEAESQY